MEFQKKKIKQKKQAEQGEESFYLQKKIQQTTKIIEKAIQKIEYILENRNSFEIDDSLYAKLEKIYEKILHIKGSTNIAKLEQV